MSGGACVGASSGGAITQLMAIGALDQYLTEEPTITFWRFQYEQHTNFAIEEIEQNFNTQVAFGRDAQIQINRTGDLMYWIYLVIDLPGITAVKPTLGICGIGSGEYPCCDSCDPADDGPAPECICCPQAASSPVEDDEDDLCEGDIDPCSGLAKPWAHWVNDIGQFLPKKACFIIGGVVIDTLYNDFLYMWEELAGKPGKRLTEMVGKRFTRPQMVQDSKQNRRLWVPLPFFFTLFSGNALPLVAMHFNAVQFTVCFESLQRSIQRSGCDVMVVKCANCQPLNDTDLNARLAITYVYLDREERVRFANSGFEYLITQVQQFISCQSNGCGIQVQLPFNHAVIELIFAVRRRKMDLCGNHFNYAGKWNLDPIRWVSLKLNNQPRFNAKEGKWFRLVQPYQHHTLIPNGFIYVYSFALHPEHAQPSGSINLSRIDKVDMNIQLQDALSDEDVEFIIYARNWNVLRVFSGVTGLLYGS